MVYVPRAVVIIVNICLTLRSMHNNIMFLFITVTDYGARLSHDLRLLLNHSSKRCDVILMIACHNSTVNPVRWNNCFVTEPVVLCIFTVSVYPLSHERESSRMERKWIYMYASCNIFNSL